jgi:cytochrome c oxidase subunit II
MCHTASTLIVFLLSVAPALQYGGVQSGSSSHITNLFAPRSSPADSIHEVALLALAVCGAIFLVVGGLLAYTIVRFRRPHDDASEPPQVYGSNQIEMAWTVLPVLIVLVLILVTARTIADVQNAPEPTGAVEVTVIGHQRWW